MKKKTINLAENKFLILYSIMIITFPFPSCQSFSRDCNKWSDFPAADGPCAWNTSEMSLQPGAALLADVPEEGLRNR